MLPEHLRLLQLQFNLSHFYIVIFFFNILVFSGFTLFLLGSGLFDQAILLDLLLEGQLDLLVEVF
jgi:hypothetical protein